jgi:ABC-2 type transport system permease protein
MKGIIRTAGFLTKEIREVIRQPSLIVVLILGPFLILFLFGIGHRAYQPPLETVMVVPRGVELPVPEDQYQQLLGQGMRLVATKQSVAEATELLRERRVDVVIVIPEDLYERLASGEQATVTVLFNEIDPVMTNYIHFITNAQISEMNSRILEAELRQATAEYGPLEQFAASVDEELTAVERDLAAGDVESAKQRIDRLDERAAALAVRLEALSRFVGRTEVEGQSVAQQRIRATLDALARFRADLAELRRDIDQNPAQVPQDLQQVRADGAAVSRAAAGLSDLPPQVIASPLESRAENIAPVVPDFVAFYAPAVLALLLQHIAVTFGALSIVRERLFGAVELFRVAPVAATQMLIGKYLAYLLLAAVVTVALTILLVEQLNVPFAGSYEFYAAIVAGLILASLGIGFCISLVSSSERQAVQLSMLTLIASVFFSGFFLRLEGFRWPVRAVSYLLPVTYGIADLQDVMLRGEGLNYLSMAALSALAVILFVVAIVLLKRELARAHGGTAGAD